MDIRTKLENIEREHLSPLACLAAQSRGRACHEDDDAIRTCFMRDRDRIIHSKAFRRLKHKTQCFLSPDGDHYRTRLTHTLEVAQISRTIARALALNEDLTEAIALGHDLGHTAFGHAGESAMDDVVPTGFSHNVQSLRVVDVLEKGGKGLNLTAEVREGICLHTGERLPSTLEGQIIRYADRIAYINHDIDDAVRAGVIQQSSIPAEITALLGDDHSSRINTLVCKMVEFGQESGSIGLEEQYQQAMDNLREFMFERVYRNPVAKSEEKKGISVLQALYKYFCENIDELPEEYIRISWQDGESVAVCDYVSGMTDRFAVAKYEELFVPKSWAKY